MVKKAIFEYKLKVRDYECDAQGHVNNANYQHYLEVTRHEFLEQHNLSFYKLHLEGIDAVVSKVSIRYKVPLKGMDQFVCTIDKLEKEGLKYIFHQSIYRLPDRKLCVKATVEVVNLVNGKLSEPETFDKAFATELKDKR